jgi:hypothetical protein
LLLRLLLVVQGVDLGDDDDDSKLSLFPMSSPVSPHLAVFFSFVDMPRFGVWGFVAGHLEGDNHRS